MRACGSFLSLPSFSYHQPSNRTQLAITRKEASSRHSRIHPFGKGAAAAQDGVREETRHSEVFAEPREMEDNGNAKCGGAGQRRAGSPSTRCKIHSALAALPTLNGSNLLLLNPPSCSVFESHIAALQKCFNATRSTV